jgi:hypothetical protein
MPLPINPEQKVVAKEKNGLILDNFDKKDAETDHSSLSSTKSTENTKSTKSTKSTETAAKNDTTAEKAYKNDVKVAKVNKKDMNAIATTADTAKGNKAIRKAVKAVKAVTAVKAVKNGRDCELNNPNNFWFCSRCNQRGLFTRIDMDFDLHMQFLPSSNTACRCGCKIRRDQSLIFQTGSCQCLIRPFIGVNTGGYLPNSCGCNCQVGPLYKALMINYARYPKSFS